MTWTAERYFTMAQQYWSRASGKARDSGEVLLDLTFACEFMIRGALCHVNPALNAASDDESLLYAAGVDANRPPRTIDITAGWRRLGRLMPVLTDPETNTVMSLFDARNRELHSDEDAISSVNRSAAMPLLYGAIVKIAHFSGQDLDDLLGQAEAQQAREAATAARNDRKRRVSSLISVCKDRFFGRTSEEQEALRAQNPSTIAPGIVRAVLRSGHHIKSERCPACGHNGVLAGMPVGRSNPILQDGGVVEEIRLVPTNFQCKCCGLEIKGLDELMSAGFGHEFQSVDHVDLVEHFNIDPMDYVDTEDIIREHERGMMYEYQDE